MRAIASSSLRFFVHSAIVHIGMADEIEAWCKLFEDVVDDQQHSAPALATPCHELPAGASECVDVVVDSEARDARYDSLAQDLDVIDLYSHDIRRPLQVIRQLRGEVKRKLRIGSLFSGMGPKSKFQLITGMPSQVVFTCDCKPGSYRFIAANGADHQACHYTDVRDVANGVGQCACHEGQLCPVPECNVLVAGFSCKPFSSVRSSRKSQGNMCHPDSDLFEVTIAIIRRLLPAVAILENVPGFTQPESKAVRASPLTRFIALFEQQLPLYSLKMVMMRGDTYMPLERKRLYLLLVNDEKAGTQSLSLTVLHLEHLVSARAARPKQKSHTLLLPDDHPAVRAALSSDQQRRSRPTIVEHVSFCYYGDDLLLLRNSCER